MEQITIDGIRDVPKRVGYGGSSLMGGMGWKGSVGVLEAAYEAGVRHYDVAPLYGYGEAERCLGEFLSRHPGQCTVTTKYGIPAAKGRSVMGLARSLARPVIQRLPGLKQRIAVVAGKVTASEARATFSAAEAKESLERSLAALRLERIDIWLLHEVSAQDLTDEGLLRFMEDQVRNGTIGTFGIGSEGSKVGDLLRLRPEYCRVLQYEWSVLDAKIEPGAAFRIHHRALTDHFRSLHAALIARKDTCRRWSDAVGLDLTVAENLAKLMLKAALVMNPKSIILFSSKRPEHIRENVRVAEDASLEPAAMTLYELVQTERHELLPETVAAVSP